MDSFTKNLFFLFFGLILAGLVGVFGFNAVFTKKATADCFAHNIACKTLSNGIKLIAIKHSAAPRVVGELVYSGVGPGCEEPGEKGIVRVLERMIFRSVQPHSFTLRDATGCWFEAERANWKQVIQVLANAMQAPVFDDESLKGVIQDGQKHDELPADRLLNAFIEGGRKDVVALTPDKLHNFYIKHYRPERATLVLFGDLDPRDAIEYAEKEFSRISGTAKSVPDVLVDHDLPHFGSHSVVYDNNSAQSVLLGWHIPGGVGSDYVCAQVASQVLTSSICGVLQHRIITQDHCAESVDVSVVPGQRLGFFSIICCPSKGRVDQCVHAISEELNALALKGVEAAVLASIVHKIRLDRALLFEAITTSGKGIPLDWVARYSLSGAAQALLDPSHGFDQVKPDDLKSFVVKYLSGERMSRIDMLPTQEFRAHVLGGTS